LPRLTSSCGFHGRRRIEGRRIERPASGSSRIRRGRQKTIANHRKRERAEAISGKPLPEGFLDLRSRTSVGATDETERVQLRQKGITMKKIALHKIVVVAAALALGTTSIATEALARGG